jgi:hypothetical protein
MNNSERKKTIRIEYGRLTHDDFLNDKFGGYDDAK